MLMKRILVVDDEPDVTLSFKTILEGKGFAVDTYNNPVDALREFKSDWYALAILDIRMPKLDGFQLNDELKKIDNKLRVIFITAYEINYEIVREIYPELKLDAFIRKPVDSHLLIRIVTEEIDRK